MTTQDQPGITRVSYANDSMPEGLPIILVRPGTKELAHLFALEAIATPELIERRDALLAVEASLTAPTTDEAAQFISDTAGRLKTIRKEFTKAHEIVKRPVLDIANSVDGVKKATLAPVEVAIERLESLASAYIAEKERQRQIEIRRQEEEIRRKQQEADRLVREAKAEAERIQKEANEKAQAEIRKQQEEARKQQEEADRKAREANAEERAKLEAEAERLRVENEKLLEQKRMEAEFDAETRAEEARESAANTVAEASAPIYATPIAAVAGVHGASVAKGWDFEEVDLAALYAHNPACVKLILRRDVTKGVVDAAAQQAGNQPFTIPGLRIFPKTKLTARSI